MNVDSNAGYCYIAGWCSPKNVYWKNLKVSSPYVIGYWFPSSNSNVEASAFIPANHATANAKYFVYFSGTYDWWYIDQSIWFDTWVRITQEGAMPEITQIKLNNKGGSTTPMVAWDEVWVYNP